MKNSKNQSKPWGGLITGHTSQLAAFCLFALLLLLNLSWTIGVRAGKIDPASAPAASLSTTSQTPADLAVVAIDTSALTTDVQTLVVIGSVRVVIQNSGGTPFDGQFAVLLFEDRNNNGTYQTGVDNALGSETFSGRIDSNGSAPWDVRVSGVVLFRDAPIYAFVDSANEIPELDETNNIGTSATESKYHPPVGDFQPKVKWQYASTQAGVYSTPVVAPLIDTNTDGLVNARDIPAVIVVDYDFSGFPARLVALRGDTGAIIFSTAAPLSAFRNAAVGDIDCDGIPEIVVPADDGRVRCFNNNGTLRWTSPSIIHNGTITLADLDGDCKSEILSGSGLVNHDGTLRWDNFFRLPGYLGGVSESRGRQVADLDLDGRPEIISGPSALDRNGIAIWYWGSFFNGNGTWTTIGTLDHGATTISIVTNFNVSDGYTAVANLDDDPYPEVIVVNDAGSGDDAMLIFEHDGRLKTGSPITLYQQIPNQLFFTLGPPTVADFDGDGQPDIAIPAQRKPNANTQADPHRATMAVYRRDGSLMWRRDLITSSAPANGIYPASAFDFDGGCTELVYQDTQRLYILNGCDGSSLFEMAINRSQDGEAVRYPVVADVDNDGGADIVLPTSQAFIMSGPARKGVLVMSDTKDNWLNARRVWNQWMYHVTNVGEDGRIPPVAVNNWQGLNTQRAQSSIDGLDRFAAPDLTVSKVIINTQTCPSSLGITARIGNGGSLHTPAGVTVNFYSGDPASGALLMGTRQTTRALYLGEFEDVTLTGITPPSGQVFVTVNDPPVETLTPSGNLSLLPHSWAQASGFVIRSFIPVNSRAYLGIDGNSSLWSENFSGGAVSTGPSYYEVRFPFPVNATSVTVQNSPANITGFLAGTLTFSNGFSAPATLNSNGEGTTFFQQQQNVTWIRLTASSISSIKSDGASVSEFIVGGSYVDPKFRLNEGAGRSGNNKAASVSGIALCDTSANQPPLINSAPPLTASARVAYAYQVQASDANNDALSFSLTSAPAGMTMSATGLISWIPANTQTGDFLVTIQVSDGRAGSANQSFTLHVVGPSNQPPVARCHDMIKTANRNVTPQEVDAGSSDPEASQVTLSLNPAGPFSTGTTVVTLTATDDAASSSQCTANVTINRGTPIISWNNPTDIIYGSPLGATQLNATASFNGTEVAGVFTYTPAAGTVLNAGSNQTLSANFTPTDATLYNEATATVMLNVLRATPTVNVRGGTFTYDGQPHPATGSVVGVNGEDLGTPTFTYDGLPEAPVNAGVYEVTASFAGIENYAPVENNLTSVVINKAPLVVTADDTSKLYGASLPSFTARYDGLVNGEDSNSLSGTLSFSTPATEASDVGIYQITPAGLVSDNYEIAFRDGRLTIAPAPLTVVADNKSTLYGMASPPLTASFSGFVPGQNQTVLGGTLTVSTQATQGSSAGTYAITPGGLTSSNYQLTFVDGLLTINRAPLTVTADDKRKLFGAALPSFTANYSGFVLGEDQSVLGGQLSFSTAATAASDVGNYAIKSGGVTSPNYEITFADGVLIVTPAPLIVKADDTTKALNAPLPIFTANYSGFVLGQTQSVLSGALTFSTAATASSNVGSYAVTPAGLTSANYALTFVDGILMVTYNVCLLYDANKAHKSGSTIPIKLRLCDASGQNVSSPQTVVTALAVVLMSNNAPGPLEDAGNANPDNNFRFTDFDGTGGYIFNLKTTGLVTGTYNLLFKGGHDTVVHNAPFQIR